MIPFVQNDRIGKFWAIRHCLGPVIESLILLDRYLYIQHDVQNQMRSLSVEHGGLRHDEQLFSLILPIFNPTLSPRNFALISVRCTDPQPIVASLQHEQKTSETREE